MKQRRESGFGAWVKKKMIQIWPKNSVMIYFNKNHLKFCKTYGMK